MWVRHYETCAMIGPQARGTAVRITEELAAKIEHDVRSKPADFGYQCTRWSGRLLARHLASSYQLILSSRHCCRLLRRFSNRPGSGVLSSEAAQIASGIVTARPWNGFSDIYRQEKALRQIRQLSVANLPLIPFAHALYYDVFAGAVNSSDSNQAFLASPPAQNTWVYTFPNAAELAVRHERFLLSTDPSVSGLAVRYSDITEIKTDVLMPEEFLAPHFLRSAGYNEFLKLLDFRTAMIGFLKDEGRLIGMCPLWKTPQGKEFSGNDRIFFKSALRHTSHGLRVAQLALQAAPEGTLDVQTGEAHIGVVTTDIEGRVLALDQNTRQIFHQTAVFDGRQVDAFAATAIRDGLRYVSQIVRQTFADARESDHHLSVPAARVWWHSAGVVLKLRGFLSQRPSGSSIVTILVEECELARVKARRLAIRYGMSVREAQTLLLFRKGCSRKQIAGRLSLSINTVKTYLREIALKMDDLGQRPPYLHV